LWWSENVDIRHGVKILVDDSHAMCLANYALMHNCEVHVYIEHTGPSKPVDFRCGLIRSRTVDHIPVEEKGKEIDCFVVDNDHVVDDYDDLGDS